MKQKLESILKKGKMITLASLMFLTIGCASSKFYIEPKIGLIIPVSAKEQTYNPLFMIGAACGFSGKTIGLESGLDYFNSSAKYIETKSILSKFNVSCGLLKETAKVKPYLTGGVNFLNESSTIDIPEFNVYDKITNKTIGLEFGIGIAIIDRINSRITYTVMPESENVNGMITLTGGYRFLFGGKNKK